MGDSNIQKKINILIPMAGLGTRFSNAGFDVPKPLIDIKGKTMIERAVECLPKGNLIFVVLLQHVIENNIDKFLTDKFPKSQIVIIDEVTKGATCTCLKAKRYINNDKPLLISDCDQIDIWNPNSFIWFTKNTQADGVICTFNSNSTKNSYLKVDSSCRVTKTVEKKVISNIAATGNYFWKHGKDFVKCAEKEIKEGNKTRGEFYICPVYNQLIKMGGKVLPYPILSHYPVGTPEDLEKYENLPHISI